VAPTYAAEKMLGTNPIAVAIPAGNEAPFVADFATTTAANGKLEIAQRKNQPIPTGWAQDVNGQSSNDAHILKKGGALLPLGSEKELGSHKGYALGSIVDIFSGVLSGASFGPWAPPFPAYIPMPENMPGEGLGHFLGAMRIDAFRPAQDFKSNMDLWLNRFRNAKPIEGQDKVYVAGDIERAMEGERMKSGIALVDDVVRDLNEVGNKFALTL
jgi:LDH2 family malate/lactate/ureidoglycolate dehydrogenase